jgi:hypothetical protein
MSNITTDSAGALTTAVTAATQFIVPVVGALTMDASATLVTLQQLKVTMNYNDRYDITLEGADAIALRDSIVLDGSGSTFSAQLAPSHTLAVVLKKVIDEAVKSGAGGKTLANELSDDMKTRFQEYFNNALSNILENVSMSSSVSSQAGANDLVGKLDNNACEVIAQQIPKDHYEQWSDASENYEGSGLPLLDGDSLVFIFDVASELRVDRTEEKTDGTTADSKPSSANGAADAVEDSDAAGANGVGSKYTTGQAGTASYIYESRRIAFFVTVDGVSPPA